MWASVYWTQVTAGACVCVLCMPVPPLPPSLLTATVAEHQHLPMARSALTSRQGLRTQAVTRALLLGEDTAKAHMKHSEVVMLTPAITELG